MLSLLKSFRYRQRGFSLVELIIVIAVLCLIAAIVVANFTGFWTIVTLNAANTEAANVRTAADAYRAESESWPATSEDLGAYLDGELKAIYNFNTSGEISSATTDADGWGTEIWFNPGTQAWEKVAPPED